MLDDIREKKTSLTTYILVGLAGIGMLFIGVPFFAIDQGNSVAEVNGQDITFRQFQQAVSNLQRNQPELPLAKAESEAIRQLISQLLLAEHASESGFRYPDQELYNTIKTQFNDEAAYQQFLRRSGMDAASYEYLVRRDMTTQTYYDILAQAQRSQPFITDTFAANLAQRRSFSIIHLPLADIAARTTVSDEEIQAYYDEHHDILMRPPEVALDYVLFSVSDLANPDNVSTEALEKARSELQHKSSQRDGEYLIFDQQTAAEQAQQALIDGTPLATITASIDDGSESGEYGHFKLHSHGDGISPAADDALFALEKSGDISPVIDTDYGFMVVIAGQIKQGEMPDDTQLRQKIADDSARTRYHELTNKAFDAAQDGADITQIATLLGVEAEQSSLFAQNDPPLTWMKEADITGQLFGEHEIHIGEMAQPVALDDEQSVFFSVRERVDAQLPPLDDIRAEVKNLAAKASAEQQLEAAAQTIADDWKTAEPPQQTLVEEFNGTLASYPDLSPGQSVDGLSGQILGDLFSQSSRVAVFTAENGDKLVTRLDAISNGESSEPVRVLITKQWQIQEQLMTHQGILEWLTKHADIRITRNTQ